MGHPRATMLPRAEELVGLFRFYCDRIEIGGSIRRLKPVVNDIEIVAMPIVPRDLFGQPTNLPSGLDAFIDQMISEGKLAVRHRSDGQRIALGQRFKALVYDGLPVDLFMVRSPAEWGAVFAIRTGPGDFSKHLVTVCREKSLACRDGALWRTNGTKVETPEEEDFFRACGVPWAPPEQRK